MALSDRKIPIIVGRNDVPTTSESEENHPNGSFLISNYNALIDNELTSIQTTLNNLDIPSTTDNLTEGTTNKYYSDNRTRLAISVTGNGSYDNATGVINISNANQSVDHISLTNTSGLVKTYTIWGDSGETSNLGTFTVTDGENGINGINGIDGVDGRGIDHLTSVDNGNGTKTITFWGDLAETINLGSVILASGVDGQDGVDGKGITNTSYNASNGTVTFTFSDATTFITGDLRGANGTNGINGVDGVSPTVTVLTQAQYTALSPNYDVNTFYVING